jgi:hypothetical protein
VKYHHEDRIHDSLDTFRLKIRFLDRRRAKSKSVVRKTWWHTASTAVATRQNCGGWEKRL